MKTKMAVIFCLILCLLCAVCTAESPKLNDGVYEGFYAQPTYLIRATVTVENGAVAQVEYEECHDPNFWATFTADEAAALSADEYIAVAGARGTTYYAKHAVVGTGNEAIELTASGDGTATPVYGNEQIADFVEWLKESPENDAWYYAQLAAGNYWVALSDGNKLENLAVYTNTLKDGTVLSKEQSRFKTKVRHWTAVGTGVGTEFGDLGWQGNMDALAAALVENQFPQGERSKNAENKVVIADVVTSATIESYQDYLSAAYAAYELAIAK